MAERTEEKIWPLAAVDAILEDYLGLPGTKTFADALPLPAKVLKALNIPTLAEIADDVVKRITEAVERRVK